MRDILKQVDLAINDNYNYKEDVLKDVEFLIQEVEKTQTAPEPMDDEAIKLFLDNYENKGLCKGLDSFIKSFDKEFKKSFTKKTIQYLPWAVVERIFRLQGGNIEVINWKYAVTFEGVKEYNQESGEIEENGTRSALFIHLRATWKGQTLEEFYPIFDNQTSKVVKAPDSQQLNTSRQRGSVRLIARLSGIGLWVFEQQDSQFEDDDKGEEKIVVKEIGTPNDAPVAKPTTPKKKSPTKGEEAVEIEKTTLPKSSVPQRPATKEEEFQDQKDDAMAKVLGIEPEQEANVADMFLGKVVKSTPTQPNVANERDFPKGSEEHSELLVKVKGFVKTHRDDIIEFKNSKGKELLQELSYLELKELLESLGA